MRAYRIEFRPDSVVVAWGESLEDALVSVGLQAIDIRRFKVDPVGVARLPIPLQPGRGLDQQEAA